MAISTILEDKIQSTLEKLFREKFNMIIGVGFNSNLDEVKVISIIIFNGNLEQDSFKYLKEILKPHLLPQNSCICNELAINFEKLSWDELINIIRLV